MNELELLFVYCDDMRIWISLRWTKKIRSKNSDLDTSAHSSRLGITIYDCEAKMPRTLEAEVKDDIGGAWASGRSLVEYPSQRLCIAMVGGGVTWDLLIAFTPMCLDMFWSAHPRGARNSNHCHVSFPWPNQPDDRHRSLTLTRQCRHYALMIVYDFSVSWQALWWHLLKCRAVQLRCHDVTDVDTSGDTVNDMLTLVG